MVRTLRLYGSILLLTFIVANCGKEPNQASVDQDKQPTKYVIGFCPKLLDNPVFSLAKTAAEKTAKELSDRYGDIEILWNAPTEADAAKQVEIIHGYINRHVDGIAVSCNNPDALQPAIDAAMEAGIPTLTFDSDSPNSKRITYYGTNDLECGAVLAENLHKAMGGKGTYAIMTGVAGAFNLETRIQGAKQKLKELHSELELVQTVYCNDDVAKSVLQIEQVMRARPNLGGWLVVGGWPLQTDNALKPIQPAGSCKFVAVDTLPMMWQYIEQGYVDALVGQKFYGWGAESVKILMAVRTENTAYPKFSWSGMDVVTKENLEEYKKKWYGWFGNTE